MQRLRRRRRRPAGDVRLSRIRRARPSPCGRAHLPHKRAKVGISGLLPANAIVAPPQSTILLTCLRLHTSELNEDDVDRFQTRPKLRAQPEHAALLRIDWALEAGRADRRELPQVR